MHVESDGSLQPAVSKSSSLPVLRLNLDLCEFLSSTTLEVRPDYYSSFSSVTIGSRISLREFIRPRSTQAIWMCPEQPLPESEITILRLTTEEGSPPSKPLALALLHAGRNQSKTPLHFDWDQRWVWHVVLHGQKEFLFADPEEGWLLSPVVNTAALNVPALSERDLAAIGPKIGLERIIVREGESVLFPSTIWHGVRYTEPCVGLSIRFEQHAGGRPFGVLPRSWWLQRLAWRFHLANYGPPAAEVFRRLAECFFEPEADWRRRWQKMQAAYRRELDALGAANGVDSWVGNNFSAELALARDELAVAYTVDEGAEAPAAPVIDDAEQYLFEGLNWSLPPELRRALAAHALRTRTGLRPRRGLLKIRADGWEKHEEA